MTVGWLWYGVAWRRRGEGGKEEEEEEEDLTFGSGGTPGFDFDDAQY